MLTSNMLTTSFQITKLVIHVAKMQQILFFVHQLMMNVDRPIGNVFSGSVMSVVLLISQELKWIHQTEHQWLYLTHIWLNLLVHIMEFYIKQIEKLSYHFTWKGKIWINSSLQIICWLRLFKRWNLSSTVRLCDK